MKQYVNRIFRLGSDESIVRHIWDICDTKLSLSNQWYTRKKHYDSKNYEIITTTVDYSEINDNIIEPPLYESPRNIKKRMKNTIKIDPIIQIPEKNDDEIVNNIIDLLTK